MQHHAELAAVDLHTIDMLGEPDDRGAVAQRLGPDLGERHRLALLHPQRRERRDVSDGGDRGRRPGQAGARRDRPQQARRARRLGCHDRHAELRRELFGRDDLLRR